MGPVWKGLSAIAVMQKNKDLKARGEGSKTRLQSRLPEGPPSVRVPGESTWEAVWVLARSIGLENVMETVLPPPTPT